MRTNALGSLRSALAGSVLMLIWAGSASGATEKIVHNFSAYPHGYAPDSSLTSDANGNFYGTTSGGGAHEDGTVFRLTPNSKGGWTQTVLYSFKGGRDGTDPYSGVIFDAAGNLYGTTYNGGAGPCNNGYGGCGTVFKLTPNSKGGWTESVIYSFKGAMDGAFPDAGLISDSAGDLYGTSQGGGATPNDCFQGCGVVFKLTHNSEGDWTESVLYSFAGGNDGATPEAGLVLDAAGNLYGTTYLGGSSSSCSCGTVFKLAPSSGGSWAESVIYRFAGGADGTGPSAALTFDSAGNLYSTTSLGGGSAYCGGVVALCFN